MVEYLCRLHGMTSATLNERLDKLFEQLRMNEFRDVPGGKNVDRDATKGVDRNVLSFTIRRF